eukprot:c54703_g1_i1 orf=3-269(-)
MGSEEMKPKRLRTAQRRGQITDETIDQSDRKLQRDVTGSPSKARGTRGIDGRLRSFRQEAQSSSCRQKMCRGGYGDWMCRGRHHSLSLS